MKNLAMNSFKILFYASLIATATALPGYGSGWDKPSHGHDSWGWGGPSHGHDSWGWGGPSHEHESWGWGVSSTGLPGVQQDKRSIDELYRAALAEGGHLIVYSGGDSAGQLDGFRNKFMERFPNMTLDLIVDFSKNQDARIDLQLETNTLVPDVVQLQTLQDFPRWKQQGVLLQYKPIGWDSVYPQFKDTDGYYTGILVDAFSNVINKKLLPNQANWPLEARDYLRPDLNGKIVATYPNDDDAVLFWFKVVTDKYGYQWVRDFVKNNVTFVRGTEYPSTYVSDGRFVATFTTDGAMPPDPTSDAVFALPKTDPFVSWPQLAAIFKNAKNPAAAKLYLSWFLEKTTQTDIWYMWSVRKDVPPPTGFRGIFEYPGQSDPTAFATFMADRAAVERFRSKITLLVGEVKGDSPPGELGLHPTVALPH